MHTHVNSQGKNRREKTSVLSLFPAVLFSVQLGRYRRRCSILFSTGRQWRHLRVYQRTNGIYLRNYIIIFFTKSTATQYSGLISVVQNMKRKGIVESIGLIDGLLSFDTQLGDGAGVPICIR